MTHADFVKAVAADVNKKYETEGKKSLTHDNVKDVITSTFDIAVDTVKKGDKITIPGFGAFEAVKRPARMGRNPVTGEAIKISAKMTPKFKAAKAFKTALN